MCAHREHRTGNCNTCRTGGTYRVGDHYGIHVYRGDRPVATFHDADEAARFVAAMNEAST